MSAINSVHEAPVFCASVGHRKIALNGHHSGPVPIASPGPKESTRFRKRQAKAAVRARREEVASGAGFLQRLTSVRGGR